MQKFENFMTNLTGNEWVATAITAVCILAVTAIVGRLLTKFLHKVLSKSDNLPASSILVNIGRGIVWIIGVSALLSTCFDVDVSAAITALGVGGIAISLGFQDTISNFIGGMQVSLLGIVMPGDNISVGSATGVVKDVSWRHTTITNLSGETIVIPNSSINKNSLKHLPPQSKVVIPLIVEGTGEDIADRAAKIEVAAAEAAGKVSPLATQPHVWFSEAVDGGFAGNLIFVIEDGSKALVAKDEALRAVAPFTRA